MHGECQGASGAAARRVAVYIDGFNLYFGLREAGWRRFYWLDLARLAENLLKPGQSLVAVKYFTSRVRGSPAKAKRQATFLEANLALGRCEIFYGHYLLDEKTCPACGKTYSVPAEKMSDVNLAVELLADAVADRFDVALLISADSDLTPLVQKLRRLYPRKVLVVAHPPKRHSTSLAGVAHAAFTIGRAKLAASLLPAEVRKTDGTVLTCPAAWSHR